MHSDTSITLVDSHQNVQSFTTLEQVIGYIRQHPRETFQIYASREAYESIRKQVWRKVNREDRASLDVIRKWKAQASSTSDLEDLNDTRERIFDRMTVRDRQLRYGGETYSSDM